MDDNGFIAFRRAVVGDAAELAVLHALSFGAEAWNEEQVRGSLVLDTTQGWLGVRDGVACGFILCQVIEGEAEILTFCVRPEDRRQGVGKMLVWRALEAMTSKVGVVWLEVAEDNAAAIALYEAAGFVSDGVRPNYYKRGDKRVNAVTYVYITRG